MYIKNEAATASRLVTQWYYFTRVGDLMIMATPLEARR